MTSLDAAAVRRARIREASSSVFNYWFGYVANVSLALWLASRAFAHGQSSLGVPAWIACAFSGLFLWTFVEYALHRFLYHELESPLKVGHDLHHGEPRSLLGVPWYITTVALLGVYYAIASVFNPARTGVVMAFAWLGYLGYCAMHHSFHHARWKAQWFVNARRRHSIHHARHDVNWGVTTPLWDVIFRTKA